MSFATLLKVLSMVPQLEVLINSIVQSVESAFGSTVAGSVKLQAAEAKLNTYLSDLNAATDVIADLKTVATPLINAAVAMFNVVKTGAFAPGAVPTSPAAAPASAPSL